MSKYGVISIPYFPVFGLNTGKYETEITPYLDTFHAVYFLCDQSNTNLIAAIFAKPTNLLLKKFCAKLKLVLEILKLSRVSIIRKLSR